MEALAEQSPEPLAVGRHSRVSVTTVLGEIIRILLASVLLYSGLSKLRAPYEFLSSVYAYELTGPLTSLAIAAVLPWLEVLTAICLWGKILYRGALATSLGLCTLFSAAVGLAIYRQLDISCGCFSDAEKISYSTLIRSISLLLASAIAMLLAKRSTHQSPM